MSLQDNFTQSIITGYNSSNAITLGAGILNGSPIKEAQVKIPLKH